MNKTNGFFVLRIAVVTVLLLTSASVSAQSGLSQAYCQAYMPVVQQALGFREQGIPIDIALDVADSAYDTNQSLWFWLRDAVTMAYSDPQLIRSAMGDGRLMQNCIEAVRGY